ncbi:hypothetical protein TKK_0014535 [Trichogramma kaykai]
MEQCPRCATEYFKWSENRKDSRPYLDNRGNQKDTVKRRPMPSDDYLAPFLGEPARNHYEHLRTVLQYTNLVECDVGIFRLAHQKYHLNVGTRTLSRIKILDTTNKTELLDCAITSTTG